MPLEWKTPAMAKGLDQIHPELRRMLLTFATYSQSQGLPAPVVTDLVRDMDEQVQIYVGHFLRLQQALEPGPHKGQMDPEGDGTWRPLTPREVQDALELRGLPLSELQERARGRFTWHWVACAADLRTRHYTGPQLGLVRQWFEARTPRPEWEFLLHDVHGPHIHVGRRDFSWRNAKDPRKGQV